MRVILLAFIAIGIFMELPTITQYAWFGIYTPYSLLQMKSILYLIQSPWYLNIVWGKLVDLLDLRLSKSLLVVVGIYNILFWKFIEVQYSLGTVSIIVTMTLCEFFPALLIAVLFKQAYLYQVEDDNIIVKGTRCVTLGKILGAVLSNLILTDQVYMSNIYQAMGLFTLLVLAWVVFSENPVQNVTSESPVTAREEVWTLTVFIFMYTLIPIYSFAVMFYISAKQSMATSTMTLIQSLDYLGELLGTFIVFRTQPVYTIAKIASAWFLVSLMAYSCLLLVSSEQVLFAILAITTVSLWSLDSSLNITFNYRINRSVEYEEQGLVSNRYLFAIFVANFFRNLITYASAYMTGLDYTDFAGLRYLFTLSLVMSVFLVMYSTTIR